ncbi:hypothetical protein PLANPX_3647 [Lacipirellula parvula]|uniref:Uncharacterized protein n=1 Tax=Lacipirellula parvula TaxID=2650471 RepID=A0A5K7XCD1_9BACT|nr:hypothetical protein PLANPX_3647 [Lacipirellula parvula]
MEIVTQSSKKRSPADTLLISRQRTDPGSDCVVGNWQHVRFGRSYPG